MKPSQFKTLKVGDIVTHAGSGNAYEIESGDPKNGFVGVRKITVTNPCEWVGFKVNGKLVKQRPVKKSNRKKQSKADRDFIRKAKTISVRTGPVLGRSWRKRKVYR